MAAFETVITEHTETWCDGSGASGHPRVYLHINSETGTVVCPYCSRTYMLKDAADYYASSSH